MLSILMKSGNGTKSDPHRLLLSILDKMDLKRSNKYFALSNPSIYYAQKNIKQSHKNNELKVSGPTSNEKFELPNTSYSASDIQEYFVYIIKNMKQ